jgi:HPt (histidine-containing phosphotransfer) domain-containing protein
MPIRKVLLLDCDETVRASLEQGSSWEVFCAGPVEAPAVGEAEKPDVVLIDAERCGSDLDARLARCRAGRGLNRAVLIVLSTAAELPGVIGIRKPLDPQALPHQVREHFRAARFDTQLARLEDIGGRDFVVEMIDLFLQVAPQRLDDARRGEQAGDLEAIAKAAHSLKSSAGNLGADAVQELAEQVEQLASACAAEAVSPLLRRLEQAFAESKVRLESARGPKP